ncbi:helix-turn-helix domain-containing protein [Aphanothece sacrum]|nr:XRE family transcriptional regulator [Aphanothece sacrum]
MSFDYRLLGKKLREARESLLIEPSEVAGILKISKNEYIKLENGEKQATGDQILRLATLYQRDFRYFITGDYPSAESQIQELFRLNSSLSKNDRLAIQEFIRFCEYEYFLEGLISQKVSEELPDYSNIIHHNYYQQQGQEGAYLERKRLQIGNSPITDIFQLIRQQGVHVFKRKLEDQNISGLYIKHPEAGHCILINYIDDLYRQNFSAAHEYCHALFDSSLEQEMTYFKTNNNNHKEREWRANSFAGYFLVPEKAIHKYYRLQNNYGEWLTLIKQMCSDFSVSSKVVIIRLHDIKWIDAELKHRLYNDQRLIIKKTDKFDPEISDDLSIGSKERIMKLIHKGLSWYFIELATEAYRKNDITYQKLLEMLNLPIEEGNELLSDLRVFMEATK